MFTLKSVYNFTFYENSYFKKYIYKTIIQYNTQGPELDFVPVLFQQVEYFYILNAFIKHTFRVIWRVDIYCYVECQKNIFGPHFKLNLHKMYILNECFFNLNSFDVNVIIRWE